VSNDRLRLLLQRLAIGLVHALLREHLHRLLAARHDGWDGGDQAQGEHVVGRAGDIVTRRESVGDDIGDVAS
jgi:hypothetical protein